MNSDDVALASTTSNRIGQKVTATENVLAELRERGLVGRDGGLTRSGSIKAEKLKNAQLDALFGPA
jgi:hypothetical protein